MLGDLRAVAPRSCYSFTVVSSNKKARYECTMQTALEDELDRTPFLRNQHTLCQQINQA